MNEVIAACDVILCNIEKSIPSKEHIHELQIEIDKEKSRIELWENTFSAILTEEDFSDKENANILLSKAENIKKQLIAWEQGLNTVLNVIEN